MPAKGSQLKYGNRDYVFDEDFFDKNLVEKHGVDLSYKKCKALINTCNKNIAEFIADDNDGFKLPNGMGYIVVGKYKPSKPAVDVKKTIQAGKKIYHLNLHTDGYAVKLFWFRVGRINNTHFHEVFKFIAYKSLRTMVSKAFGSGKKMYSEWSVFDFIEKGRIENLLNKKYRKELKK